MITVSIEKAKLIAHEIRRKNRSAEFAPLDDLIAKQIPGVNFQDVEQKRQEIRDKYSVIQNKIDSSTGFEEIKSAIDF